MKIIRICYPGVAAIVCPVLFASLFHNALGFATSVGTMSARTNQNSMDIRLMMGAAVAMDAPPAKVKRTKTKAANKSKSPPTTKTVNNEGESTQTKRATRKKPSRQFLMRKWKSRQAAEKKRKAEEASAKNQVVSAIGLSVSEINEMKASTNQARKHYNKKKRGAKVKGSSQSKKRSNNRKQVTKKKDLLPWDSLVPGSTVSGTVIKLLPYGALVRTNYDIPGKTYGCALLHISQIADEKINNLSDVLPVGSSVDNARVVSINRGKGTVGISLRTRGKRATPMSSLAVDDEVEGKVVRLKKYGAFVDVGSKRNALLHISRMSMYRVSNITDHVSVGQPVRVRILRIDPEAKNIAVSMLSKENDAWKDRREKHRERLVVWQRLVDADNDEEAEAAKKELLEIDRIIWDQFMATENGVPRSMEV